MTFVLGRAKVLRRSETTVLGSQEQASALRAQGRRVRDALSYTETTISHGGPRDGAKRGVVESMPRCSRILRF